MDQHQKGIAMRFLIFIILIVLFSCGRQAEDNRSRSQEFAIDSTVVISEGQQITQVAFQTLSSNLKQALQEGGVEHALQFCSVEAIPLTDSLSMQYGIELRRASHRPRNPDNRADSLELVSIRQYLQQIRDSSELKPLIYRDPTGIAFHAPIRIPGELCLNCHGNPGSDITEKSLAIIQQRYPGDEATGFAVGDLRGVWSIHFPTNFFEADSNRN